MAAGHRPASRQVELNGHPETAQLTLPLAREAHGFVRAPGGEPVPEGRFAFVDVPSGRYTL